jgi:hypothetical protein
MLYMSDMRRREEIIIHLRKQLVVYESAYEDRAFRLERALIALTNDPSLCSQPYVVPRDLSRAEIEPQERRDGA